MKFIVVQKRGKMAMSSDDEKIEDLKDFLSHLSVIKFSGTIMLSFSKGTLSSVSKKDDLIPGRLREVARRSVYIKKKKVSISEEAVKEPPLDGAEVQS